MKNVLLMSLFAGSILMLPLLAGPAQGETVVTTDPAAPGLTFEGLGALSAEATAKSKPAAAKSADPKATVTPVPSKPKWRGRHDSIKANAKKGGIDVMFIGDSITQGWEGSGKAVWAKDIAPLKAGNFGISGDRTQNVLWRLDNGELPKVLQPKVAVIMIGTNNSNKDNSPEAIAAGITAIIDKLNAHNPKTKILLLAIFPRGANAADGKRKINEATNTIIAKLEGTKNVHFMDINAKFLQPDGTLPKDIMPDFLHPNAKGYQIWADAVVPEIKKLLAE